MNIIKIIFNKKSLSNGKFYIITIFCCVLVIILFDPSHCPQSIIQSIAIGVLSSAWTTWLIDIKNSKPQSSENDRLNNFYKKNLYLHLFNYLYFTYNIAKNNKTISCNDKHTFEEWSQIAKTELENNVLLRKVFKPVFDYHINIMRNCLKELEPQLSNLLKYGIINKNDMHFINNLQAISDFAYKNDPIQNEINVYIFDLLNRYLQKTFTDFSYTRFFVNCKFDSSTTITNFLNL